MPLANTEGDEVESGVDTDHVIDGDPHVANANLTVDGSKEELTGGLLEVE